MPLSLTVEVAAVLEKSGFITAPSVSTAASTTSPMTLEGVGMEDDFDLLTRLQGTPIHVPPGPPQTGALALTKTQIMAEQKAQKDAKAKASEEKRLLVASHKIKAKAKQQEAKAKQQEKLILMAEDKAAKVTAITEELCLILEEAITASTVALAKNPPPPRLILCTCTRRVKEVPAVPLLALLLFHTLTFLPREKRQPIKG